MSVVRSEQPQSVVGARGMQGEERAAIEGVQRLEIRGVLWVKTALYLGWESSTPLVSCSPVFCPVPRELLGRPRTVAFPVQTEALLDKHKILL